jgi:hypothetical protein
MFDQQKTEADMGILDFNCAVPIIDDETAQGGISIWPDNASGAELHNRRAAEARMMTLLGFMAKARRNRPREALATASGFAAWIYSLYGSAYGDADDRERGKEVEQEVLERRRRAASCNDSSFLRAMQLNWRLVHNGIQPQPEGSPPISKSGACGSMVFRFGYRLT